MKKLRRSYCGRGRWQQVTWEQALAFTHGTKRTYLETAVVFSICFQSVWLTKCLELQFGTCQGCHERRDHAGK